ncbi:flavoprotein [Kutzneria sp. NPDC052558]|uniref:flavoprotein n=1 Tax=Kutzneria sp. NPDC052558 TaxID=3364121 RepID=UPI0037C63B57
MLGVVASGAGGVEGLFEGLVRPALAAGWRVGVTLTPTAGRWFHESGLVDEIEKSTGLPLRVDSRLPREPKPHPPVDTYVVAPATANTVAKLALGFGDNQALTQVSEAIGTHGVEVVVFPCVNAAHVRHPAWPGHIAALKAAGVRLVDGEDVWPLKEPRSGEWHPIPWQAVLDEVNATRP